MSWRGERPLMPNSRPMTGSSDHLYEAISHMMGMGFRLGPTLRPPLPAACTGCIDGEK